MQIGLWYAENRWDEMGSTAYLEAASSAGKVEEAGKGKAPGWQFNRLQIALDAFIGCATRPSRPKASHATY